MLKPVIAIATLVLSVAAASTASAQPYGNNPNDWRPGAGWDRDIDVRCGSNGYKYNMCQVDTGRGSRVSLVRQLSKTQCVEGRNWGWNRAGVWVDQGCEGVFRVQRRWVAGPGPGPGPGWNRDIRLNCGSYQFKYNLCQVDTGPRGRVRMVRQTSDARCVEGRTWGWNRAGVWVDRGCGADFVVERR